jgi:hypothetical protein
MFFTGSVQMSSLNSIPEISNTAHSCCQHGPATAWLTSELSDKNIYSVGSISTLFLAIKSLVLKLHFVCSFMIYFF